MDRIARTTLAAAVACSAGVACAQELVINGSFEDTSATATQYNLSNFAFNALMPDTTAFGADEELDVMDAGAIYGSAPIEGDWKIGVSHGDFADPIVDALALHLHEPIVFGRRYELTLVAQSALEPFSPELAAVEFGVSDDPLSFGTRALVTPQIGGDGWQTLGFAFDAPADGAYLTVRGTIGPDAWTHIDLVSLVGGEPCRADFDGDGQLTIFDFLAFQNAFDAGDLVADFDGDGALTIFDFLAFQNEFDLGCD